MIGARKQERPASLRSSVVDRYVRQILKPDDKEALKRSIEVVKTMVDLQLDHRAINNMKQQINEKIDESGLIHQDQFKSMYLQNLGRNQLDKGKLVFDKLLPLIQAESEDGSQEWISMNKLTTFIDFFNFYPFMLKQIRHKNNTSKDLFLYLGIRDIDYDGEKQHKGKTTDKDEIIEKRAMLKALALISNKINERFANLSMAFRYFDYDKSQILGLNKFV